MYTTALAWCVGSAAISIPFVQQFINDDGEVQANEVMDAITTAMLDELRRWVTGLQPLREGVHQPA
jgi:hypothetical protein